MADPYRGQRLEEILPVNVIQIDVLAPIPSTHHMVDGTWIFDSQLARHALLLSYTLTQCKEEYAPIYGLINIKGC